MPINGTSPFHDPVLVGELLHQTTLALRLFEEGLRHLREAAVEASDAWAIYSDQLSQEARSEPLSGDPWARFSRQVEL